ncbi:hypothetical protein [Shewanella litoralis]|uniref:Uncharacterized protein n=1 Tax=Shewanella litoralis TaxID=2282700 RepID=A0ABQ2RHU6_9GAMM|nr:hypothetical protein [Shewanella litoralis]GGQ26609.1 hypothetical protein GCM10009411_28180 [Shewanella litoralis]
MNTIKALQLIAVCLCWAAAIQTSFANEAGKPNTTAVNNKPVVIESQVTGSQEQPKVLYIMPWQGITNPIDINNKDMRLTLPEFKPINPKAFRQQVRDFANSNQQTE